LAINDRVEPGDIVRSHDTLRPGVESIDVKSVLGSDTSLRSAFLSCSTRLQVVAGVWLAFGEVEVLSNKVIATCPFSLWMNMPLHG
jgi:hypothetical protein